PPYRPGGRPRWSRGIVPYRDEQDVSRLVSTGETPRTADLGAPRGRPLAAPAPHVLAGPPRARPPGCVARPDGPSDVGPRHDPRRRPGRRRPARTAPAAARRVRRRRARRRHPERPHGAL